MFFERSKHFLDNILTTRDAHVTINLIFFRSVRHLARLPYVRLTIFVNWAMSVTVTAEMTFGCMSTPPMPEVRSSALNSDIILTASKSVATRHSQLFTVVRMMTEITSSKLQSAPKQMLRNHKE
jgi:hypothetical protein